MAILNLFSKRQKVARGEMPDVFVYNCLPPPLRGQIVHIICDALGRDHQSSEATAVYRKIYDLLCREHGHLKLTDHSLCAESIFHYFLQCTNHEQALDVVELSFCEIDGQARTQQYQQTSNRQIDPDEAILDLNARFKEHGVGYQYESGNIMRIDSQLMHSEVVKPVLALLNESIYKGANDEFLMAHEHHRHGRQKECVNEALKSFESVMKAICAKHEWEYKQTDTAKTLIDICLKNDLIPSYLQSQFTALKSILESGLPTIRNKLSAHGQGTEIIEVPESLARYVLHLTAANILFLGEYEKNI